jgi:HAD superfamily hydrolase (TIGR01459 family)
MQYLTNLSTVIDNYDALLLDLWGVVHDGTHLYPGVHAALQQLRDQDKKIIFVSNAPRRAKKAAAVLTQLGIEAELYDQVITSGELGYQWLASGQMPWRKKYFYIGPSKDADVLDGLEYHRVDDIKQADFLLNVGFGSEEESAEDWTNLLRAAKALKLPMLCLNPDFEVVKISGERFACAGVLAADYEKCGGEVKYFGKPFPEVYAKCMEWFALPKAKVLAIGDGIATDIAGAVSAGIDAMLITGGIIKKESPQQVAALCAKYHAVPKYVMPQLAW